MTPATPAITSRVPRALVAILLVLALAACSPTTPSVAPSAAATPAATPSAAPPSAPPSVAPSVAATPGPSTATASGSARPDPAADLKIAAPYTLAPLDPALEATLGAQLGQLGSVGSLFGVGGRSILKDGKAAGFVEVIGLPPGMLTEAMYTTLLGALEPNTGATFTNETVDGVTVSKAATPTAGLTIFHSGDNIIMTVVPTTGDLDAATKALIEANT
jgi:hypothetical protein